MHKGEPAEPRRSAFQQHVELLNQRVWCEPDFLDKEGDIRAYDAERDAKRARQSRRAKAAGRRAASRSRYALDPAVIAAGKLPDKAPAATITGISTMPSCRAASTRAWPAIRPPSSPTSAGVVQPHSLMLAAIAAT